MKNKIEIEIKLVELYYNLDKLKDDETHGYSKNTLEIEKLLVEINTFEWVINEFTVL